MNKCKWCSFSVKIDVGPADRLDWTRWRCNGCGSFGYVNDPSPDELAQVYELAWDDPHNMGAFAIGSTSEQIANSLLNAVKWTPSNSNCLDYGGGKGHFSNTLMLRGCKDLTVFEPFGENPKIASVNWINDLDNLGDELFDWIFMIEVVEHLLDPENELKRVRKYLAPGGKLVITTPNAKGWRSRRAGFAWREAQNPTHINLFSETTLKTCLLNAGFAKATRVLRPVKYNAKDLAGIVLSITQMTGLDGGLRFIAVNH